MKIRISPTSTAYIVGGSQTIRNARNEGNSVTTTWGTQRSNSQIIGHGRAWWSTGAGGEWGNSEIQLCWDEDGQDKLNIVGGTQDNSNSRDNKAPVETVRWGFRSDRSQTVARAHAWNGSEWGNSAVDFVQAEGEPLLTLVGGRQDWTHANGQGEWQQIHAWGQTEGPNVGLLRCQAWSNERSTWGSSRIILYFGS